MLAGLFLSEQLFQRIHQFFILDRFCKINIHTCLKYFFLIPIKTCADNPTIGISRYSWLHFNSLISDKPQCSPLKVIFIITISYFLREIRIKNHSVIHKNQFHKCYARWSPGTSDFLYHLQQLSFWLCLVYFFSHRYNLLFPYSKFRRRKIINFC